MAIKVLITEKKGYPIAIITGAERRACQVHTRRAHSLRRDESGALIMPADYWYEFVALNKEAFGLQYVDDVEIDKASKPYYGFVYYGGEKGMFRSRLTDKFIYDFFNYDASRIVRYEPNTTDGRNMLGMKMAEFETVIFENGYPATVDEDTTIEECNQILKGCHPDSAVAKVLKSHIETLSDPTIDAEAILQEVLEYEASLNAIFQQYKEEIAAYTETLDVRPLDCGFTIVNTCNSYMKDCYQKLISLGKRSNANVNVNFPDNYFCCSQSRLILNKLKELSGNPILDSILVRTVLD
jgi:hypothetical protein